MMEVKFSDKMDLSKSYTTFIFNLRANLKFSGSDVKTEQNCRLVSNKYVVNT